MKGEKKAASKIKVLTIDEVKTVNKPWGWERWIAEGGPEFPYALKEIFIKAPYKSSIQVHRDKQETNYVQRGRGILHYSERPIDIVRYLKGGYTQEELTDFINGLKKRQFSSGTVFHILPGFVHRVEAVEDLTMIETSTVHLDDIYRLDDDFLRGHGRIKKEHI